MSNLTVDDTPSTMIINDLEKIGLSKNEVALYLTLCELGESPAAELAKRVSLPRTTAYSVLESLKERGLVYTAKHGKKTYFVANHPTALTRELEEQQNLIESRLNLAQIVIEQMEPLFRSKVIDAPTLKFYEGSENVRSMLFDQLPNWENSMRQYDNTWWGFQDHTFVDSYPKWLKHQWKRNKKAASSIKLFSNPEQIEKQLKGKIPLRDIKPLPLEYSFNTSLWIAGDYIIMIHSEQAPHYSFQIREKKFAENLRAVFRLLWAL